MLTDSMQDVEQFIRMQREKLNHNNNGRVQSGSSGYNQANINPQTMEYHRQLDNYLASLARSEPYQPSQQQLAYPPPAGPPMPAYYQQQQPMFESPQPPPLPQPLNARQRQQPPSNQNDQNDFFNKFGSKYDAQKNKLNNDLRQDYLRHQQQKNASEGRRRNGRGQGDNEYYATLPLKGMESAQEKNRVIRNLEYQILQQKLQSSEKQHLIEWWKDHGEPDVKPYSKHASQENLSSIKTGPFSMESKPQQTRNQYDVISDRRLHVQNSPRGSNPNLADMMQQQQQMPFRNNSADILMRQQLADTWRPVPQPISNPVMFDSSGLSDILMRPPVGSNKMGSMMTSRNVASYNNNNDASMMMNMMSRQPPQQMPVNDMRGMQQLSHSNPNMFNSGSGSLIQQMNKPVTSGVDGGFMFTEEQNKDLKSHSKKEYQDELKRQMMEKQMAKQREKEEQERLEKKMLMEANMHNPFGRSGGGAPIKDKEGNVVADLSQVRADPDQYSPRSLVPPSFAQQMSMQPAAAAANNSRSSEMLAYIMANQPAPFGSDSNRLGNKIPQLTNGTGDPSYVRGGNGIFGDGKTEEQIKRDEKYKEELKQQMLENQRKKEMEKEKLRLEEEKEMRRIEEHNQKMKKELEEEEKKKRAKEEAVRQVTEDAKQRVEEEKKNKNKVRKYQPAKNTGEDGKMTSNERTSSNLTELPSNKNNEFRTNSPPIPTIAKSKKTQAVAASRTSVKPPMSNAVRHSQANFNAPADYYNTESRLNLASPAHNKTRSTRNDDVILNKPVLRKVSARPGSNTSNDNTEVLSRLQNLKKHLHKEQQEVENQLHNNNNHTTVGQLTDLNQDLILNVRTPPGDRYGQRTYRKDLTTPPLGMENGHPKSYYRDDTVYLGANGNRNRDPFESDLQAQARDRNSHRGGANNFQFDKDPFSAPSDADNLAINNQIRLKKLRDSEADSYSMNDPNEVLDKFMSRHNNRQPSARTIHDDTWLRQPN